MTDPAGKGGAKGPAAYQAKLKRLLDLVVLLLDARQPLSFDDIRDQFPEYRTAKPEAGKRTFERDKADLLELGVPLEWISPDGDDGDEGDGEGGYTIRRRAFALPPIDISADEAALIYVAASAARSGIGLPYLDAASLAQRKLAFDLPPAHGAGAPPPILVNLAAAGADDPAFQKRLAAVHDAVRRHKRLHISYQAAPPPLGGEALAAGGALEAGTTARDVDPYGLLYRDGAWVMVGFCHLRQDVRTFRVDRILELRAPDGGTRRDFEVPDGFSVAAHGSRSPWCFEAGRRADVTLVVAPSIRFVADEDFGARAERRTRGDGVVEVRFSCANLGFLRERVLAAGGGLTIAEPGWLRDEVAAEMARTLARYEVAS